MKDVLIRAKERNEEQYETGKTRNTEPQVFERSNLQCLVSVHVDDIKGTAAREVAEPLLKQLNVQVGQRTADYDSFLHIGIQHEHSAAQVFTDQYVYIDSITPIDSSLFTGKDDEALCGSQLHEAYRSVLGVVAWIVRTRAELPFTCRLCKDERTPAGSLIANA